MKSQFVFKKVTARQIWNHFYHEAKLVEINKYQSVIFNLLFCKLLRFDTVIQIVYKATKLENKF